MRRTWFFLTAAVFSILVVVQASRVDAQQPAPVHITRLYTGADGLSHFEQADVPMQDRRELGMESPHLQMAESFIVRLQPGFFENWHNADARRYVVPISGKAEIEVSGGGKFTVEPGQICLAEDLTGKGHTFRVVGDQQWVGLFVNFAK